jgi:predicted RNase H-like HicB family nuclease
MGARLLIVIVSHEGEARMRVVVVSAEWDDEAKVWVAEGTNLEGLVTEAETVEALRARLAMIVPDLLDEYGETEGDIAIEVIAHSHDHVPRRRAAA